MASTYTSLFLLAVFGAAFQWAVIHRLGSLIRELEEVAPILWRSLGAPKSYWRLRFSPERRSWGKLVRTGAYKDLPEPEAVVAIERCMRHLNILFAFPFTLLFALLASHFYGMLAT